MRRLRTVAPFVLVLAAVGCGDDSDGGGGDTGDARVVEITAVEYAFEASESITIATGDTITFRVTNEGELDHELQVLTDANRRLGQTERIEPGATDEVTVTFEEAGVYQVICDIDDHFTRGQRAQFTVD